MDSAAFFFVAQMLVCYPSGECLGTVQEVQSVEECMAMISAAESTGASVNGECNEYPMTEYARFFPTPTETQPDDPPFLSISPQQ